jgi:hypothetical protein
MKTEMVSIGAVEILQTAEMADCTISLTKSCSIFTAAGLLELEMVLQDLEHSAIPVVRPWYQEYLTRLPSAHCDGARKYIVLCIPPPFAAFGGKWRQGFQEL